MKAKRVFSLGSVVVVLAVLGTVAHLSAGEKPKSRNVQSFTVVVGPLEFIGLTPLSKRGDAYRSQRRASLETVEMVTLAGEEALSLVKGAEIYVGETIESGTIMSTGAMSILLDSNGKEVVLQSGEGVVVRSQGHTSCKDCAALAVKTCPGGVASVTCGADGACGFTCFDTA